MATCLRGGRHEALRVASCLRLCTTSFRMVEAVRNLLRQKIPGGFFLGGRRTGRRTERHMGRHSGHHTEHRTAATRSAAQDVTQNTAQPPLGAPHRASLETPHSRHSERRSGVTPNATRSLHSRHLARRKGRRDDPQKCNCVQNVALFVYFDEISSLHRRFLCHFPS